jgi:uncharacterized FlaG/YvyC family protein
MDIVSVSHPGLTSQAEPAPQSHSKLTEKHALIQAVNTLNASQLLGEDGEWTLTIDQQTRLPVIHIISRQTNQVVMQVPAEYILRLHEELQSRPDSYQQSAPAATDQDEVGHSG